ncbi:C6 transcription factor [Colletotrichum tofieldiae]|nr:C6 transcription factor [Colletotrichum tofieldiae]GKT71842.1 C6 transcription factor [Colletotrichum tofieldiae]
MQEAGSDNLGQLFQAQLELIQLFSNAHDILYSSSSHRAQLYLGGDTPDARFIYESMDAANSLLNILNTSVDPATGLRYMPLKYYLYVIYAAARLAGALGSEASDSVRRSINVTIECLQQSSLSAHSLGQRYARLLSLLWRSKPQEHHYEQQPPSQLATAATGLHGRDADGPGAVGPGFAPALTNGSAAVPAPVMSNVPNPSAGFGVDAHAEQQGFGDAGNGQGHSGMAAFPPQSDLLCRGFSWRDLDDLGQFIGPADMNFSDPGNLAAMGGSINLDDGAAYNVLWPGNDVVF